jgi:hypothetical protein
VRWLWLDVGRYREGAYEDALLTSYEATGQGVRLVGAPAAVVTLPQLKGAAPAPAVEEGMLVKAPYSDELFYVERGRLRWIPSLEVLERRGIPWRLAVLDSQALWRLPVGPPLS